MASVTANGITIEYETLGHGEPLLLVMGLGGQLSDWPRDFVAQLAEAGFEVIIYDNRDMGLSTEFDWEPPSLRRSVFGALARRPPEVGYLLADMAADAAGLLDALDIDSAHVVGMSMGGMIGQQLALDHPARVRSLGSIMSHTGDGKNGLAAVSVTRTMLRQEPPTRAEAPARSVENFLLWAGPHFDRDEHFARAQVSVDRSFRPDGLARQTAAILSSPDRTPRLAEVTVPTLVIHGLLDTLVRPSGGIATARAVPHSTLVMYPDMGHDLPRPRWTEMIGEIRRNADRATRSLDSALIGT